LIDQLEAASGRDLTPWVSTWLRTAGVNTLRPIIEVSGDTYASISIKQEAPTMPVGSKELRPHRLHVGLFDIAGDKLTRRTSVELDVAGALTEVTALAGEKVADLVLINDKDQTYAKLRFDDRSIATMKSHLGSLDDSLARGLIWASLWDSCRDGELSATDYVTIALNALKSESDISIVSATLMQIDTAIWAFARAFANFAFTPAQFDRVKAILDGSISGLVIDAEIRWYIFICGVKRGVFGPTDIESESAKDQTAHGKQYTARAYASIPTKDAKSKAFDSITTDNLSNTIHSYTCLGFNENIHHEILADFVDPYFDSILKVWETKGYEIAETTANLLFPSWVITPETLAKAEHWLNVTGKDASHALRRAITEGRDAMSRALKARAADL
jgi:aminopeptidase N